MKGMPTQSQAFAATNIDDILPTSMSGVLPDFIKQNQLIVGSIFLMLFGTLVTYLSSIVFQLVHVAKEKMYHYFVAMIEVRSADVAFDQLLLYINDQGLLKTTNNISVNTIQVGRHQGIPSQGTLVFSPGSGTHTFYYKGKRIWLQKKATENAALAALSGGGIHTVFLQCYGSNQILKDLFTAAKQYAHNREGGVVIFTPHTNRWVKCANTRPKRPLESIVLEVGQAKAVADDVDEFLRSQNWYQRRGLSYRRGYLFYGPPGSGKSSLLFGIASHFELPIYCLGLSDSEMTDTILQNMLVNVPSGAAVVLEDVDAVFSQRDSSVKNSVTFSGLLNAIDGVAASEGRLLFLTTNHREKLDPALIRPGRVDLEVPFSNATSNQIRGLFNNFYEEEPGQEKYRDIVDRLVDKIPPGEISMARLQGHFLMYKMNPHAAVDRAADLLKIATVEPEPETKMSIGGSMKATEERLEGARRRSNR